MIQDRLKEQYLIGMPLFRFAGYLIADEFPAELSTGAAYVAGLDGEGRPVLVTMLEHLGARLSHQRSRKVSKTRNFQWWLMM